MKVLIVCSGTKNKVSPFIKEQVDSLVSYNIEFSIFQITKSGIIGYLSNIKQYKSCIKKFKPDIIHAHYGLSGLFANSQRKIPVITTFHGSDINDRKVLFFSRFALFFSKSSIFVSKKMIDVVKCKSKNKINLIPCGVDLNCFNDEIENKFDFKEIISAEKYNILFSSAFDNLVKNYSLAKAACIKAENILDKQINLIELKGFSRKEVAELMKGADCLLLTSFSEGSPQFIKEGMAMNRPIVATDVGDIKWLFGNEPGHFLTDFNPENVANNLQKALEFSEKQTTTNGRKRIIELGLDSETIASRIVDVYKDIIEK